MIEFLIQQLSNPRSMAMLFAAVAAVATVLTLAMPLLAVLSLGASPGEMGVLRAVNFAPYLLSLPVGVNEVDVATPTGRAVVVLGFMTYFVLFALLMGGLYLAIDSTAGERERGIDGQANLLFLTLGIDTRAIFRSKSGS